MAHVSSIIDCGATTVPCHGGWSERHKWFLCARQGIVEF